MKHVNLRVYGQVQGVFYRSSAQAEAENLKLTGWARNETDGSVSIEIEGEAEAVEKFITWSKVGPRYAKVLKVEVAEAGIKGYTSFQIE
jgi:acylphosphatase